MTKAKLTIGAGKSPLTPEQQARWQDKVESGGIATVVPRVRYYTRSFPGANVYRVKDHEYSYLDHESGTWVPHPAVTDAVTGIGGDADTYEISERQAQALIRRFTGKQSGTGSDIA